MKFTQEQMTAVVNREVAKAIEMAAQRLYDVAEMQTTDLQIQLYCGAAEIVRRVQDAEVNDNAYAYNGEV
jgi:hypothetical protein